MFHLSPLVFFIQKSRLDQSSCMLRNSFDITIQIFSDLFKRQPRLFENQHQYGHTPMVSHSFKVSLELLCCFSCACFHIPPPRHSHILENVGMSFEHGTLDQHNFNGFYPELVEGQRPLLFHKLVMHIPAGLSHLPDFSFLLELF